MMTTTNGPAPTAAPVKLPPHSGHLRSDILATMDRRSVAAHPWHDLEIGNSSPLPSTIPAASTSCF